MLRQSAFNALSPFFQHQRFFSTSLFSRAQFYENADEAVKDISDGATILAGGFYVVGIPENCWRAVAKRGPKQLTVAAITTGIDGSIGIPQLIAAKQIKRLVTTFTGFNRESCRQYIKGETEVEFTPLGTFVERIRAAGAGIPAFFTPTGCGTLVEKGGIPIKYKTNGEVAVESKPREVRTFKGRSYILEEALTADFALIKAWKADRKGNLIFRKTSMNVNPEMAKAAKVTIAEVEEIVETGELEPDRIDIPHIYVDRVFKGQRFEKSFAFSKLSTIEGKALGDLKRQRIARRAVLELKDGMFANLGVGIPNAVANYLKSETVTLQSEIGILGVGTFAKPEEIDFDLINTGSPVTTVKGAACFSLGESFAMIRGGHLDWTILGALQVSKNGDLANWMVPGKSPKGMGGAMDLVSNPNTKVMVAMEHTEKTGAPKIVEQCSLPLTGKNVVKMIVTEMGVFDVCPINKNGGLTLMEIADGVTVDQIKAATGCDFKVSDSLKPMAQAEL